jgi:hypothetical protein
VVIVTVAALQARRGPDWRLVLNEYIAQSALPGEAEPLQSVAAARHPGNFHAAMGQAVQSCTQKVGPSACVRKLTSSRSCAMIDRGGQYGKAVFAEAQVPDGDGGAEG